MNSLARYKVPALALVAYFVLCCIFYNQLQYLLDSDAVAYLTIARRVAAGDWFKSINGLWSPLNSWVLVPFIKNGINAWKAALGLNIFFGSILIIQFWGLLKQLRFSKRHVMLGTTTVVIPICFFAYFQIFGDVLQLIFGLAYIRLCLRKDFILNTRFVLFASAIMGIGYYAKAYSFVFFVLHFTIIAFMAYRRSKANRTILIRNYALGIGFAILLVLPWAVLLQKKYNTFALTGLAGKLNMSWYINSGKTFKDSIHLVVPPPYEDAPSFWEDPYQSAGKLSTPFSSTYHFKRWVLRVGHTCLMAAKSVSEITLFFIPLFLVFAYRLFRKRKLLDEQRKILWAILLLPSGYLAMHIETRYIWLLMFLILPLGLDYIKNIEFSDLVKRVLFGVFYLSIVVYPLYKLQHLGGKNKKLFELAKELEERDIQGRIVSNIDDEGSFWVVSYLAKLNNYTIEHGDYSLEELVGEMKRYNIQYYYHFPQEGGRFSDVDEPFKKVFHLVFTSSVSTSSLYKLRF